MAFDDFLLHENEGTAPELELTEPMRSDLLSAANWAKFISICSIVLWGFLILYLVAVIGFLAVIMPEESLFQTSSPMSMSYIYLILFLVVIIMSFFIYIALQLYHFSQHMSRAVWEKNNNALDSAFNKLKRYFILNIFTVALSVALGFLVFMLTFL